MRRASGRSTIASASRTSSIRPTSPAWCCSSRRTTAGCARRRISLSMAAGSRERSMRLVQFQTADAGRKVGWVTEDGDHLRPLKGYATVYDLAAAALERGGGLEALVKSCASDERIDYVALLKSGRVLAPLDHPE